MKLFFEHFPPELSEKIAFKMMCHKMESAYEKFKKGDESYLMDLDKLKDMLTIFLQEAP